MTTNVDGSGVALTAHSRSDFSESGATHAHSVLVLFAVGRTQVCESALPRFVLLVPHIANAPVPIEVHVDGALVVLAGHASATLQIVSVSAHTDSVFHVSVFWAHNIEDTVVAVVARVATRAHALPISENFVGFALTVIGINWRIVWIVRRNCNVC